MEKIYDTKYDRVTHMVRNPFYFLTYYQTAHMRGATDNEKG